MYKQANRQEGPLTGIAVETSIGTDSSDVPLQYPQLPHTPMLDVGTEAGVSKSHWHTGGMAITRTQVMEIVYESVAN